MNLLFVELGGEARRGEGRSDIDRRDPPVPSPSFLHALVPVCSRPRFSPSCRRKGGEEGRCRVGWCRRPGCSCNQGPHAPQRCTAQEAGTCPLRVGKPGEDLRRGVGKAVWLMRLMVRPSCRGFSLRHGTFWFRNWRGWSGGLEVGEGIIIGEELECGCQLPGVARSRSAGLV